MSRESILHKVRKILDRAEGTDHQGEIDAALAMAAKLMAQHAIEQAEVDAIRQDGKPEQIIERVVVVGNQRSPIAVAKGNLSVAVAEHNRCQVFRSNRWSNEHNATVYRLHIIGYESDVDYVEMLWTSLCLQMDAAHNAAKHKRPDWVTARTFRSSFCAGFTSEAWERLKAIKQQTIDDIDADSGKGTALVLVDRERAVQDYMRRNHYNLRKGRGRSSSDAYSNQAGRNAASRADYSGGRTKRFAARGALGA